MSYYLADAAIKLPNLTPGQKLVLIGIASFADANGKCWPSVRTLAKRLCMGIRTVNRHIADLLKLGYLERLYRSGHSAVTRITARIMGMFSDDTTSAKMADLPLPNWQTESVTTESINEITAPVKKISTGAAEAAFVVSESENTGTPEALPSLPEVATLPDDEAIIPEVEGIPDVATVPDVATAPINPLQDVPNDLLNDFGIVRKNKKKSVTITRTEATLLSIEAQKAGLTMAQAITTCILRGWSRFEAAWIPQQAPQQAPQRLFVPETVQPASLETVATGQAALAALRNSTVSNDPLSWAKKCIDRVKTGEHVSHIALRNACSALGIDHRTISKG